MNRSDRKRRRIRGLTITVFALLLLSFVFGCAKTPEAESGVKQTAGMEGGSNEKQETEAASGSGRLKVVTTLFPYYDFVRQVAGDRVELSMVIPAGMDSHSFEPTPKDIRMIQNADILIANGGTMELWVERVLDSFKQEAPYTVMMMDHVDTVEEEIVEGMEHSDEGHHHKHVFEEDDHDDHDDHDYDDHDDVHDRYDDHDEDDDHDDVHDRYDDHDEEDDHDDHDDHDYDDHDDVHDRYDDDEYDDHDDHDYDDHDDVHDRYDDHDDDHHYEIEYDEHIWTSPVNAIKMVRTIETVLKEADPQNANFYESSADEYVSKLEQLDQEFRTVRAEAIHDIIIMGDKFPLRYFADEYDLRYRAAFSGCSSDTEPSAKTIAYLIDKIREEKLPAVYYLELSSHRVAEIISEETGAKPLLFHSCHNVTRREFENGVTYLELMEQNVINLREGLCK